MEKDARTLYLNLKETTTKIGKRFLQIKQILAPLRVACAGGPVPLSNNAANPEEDEDEYEQQQVGRNGKQKVAYSKFAYTSKLEVLLKELERVRDEDPSCKFLSILPIMVYFLPILFSQMSFSVRYSQELDLLSVQIDIELA